MLRPGQGTHNEDNTTQEQEGGAEHQDRTGPARRVIQQEGPHADDDQHHSIEQEGGHVVV